MRVPVETADIVVDMGGTTTRMGVWHADRLLGDVVRFATPKPDGGASIRDRHLDEIAHQVARLRARHHPVVGMTAVGIAVGATVDSAGRVRNAAMLWHEQSGGFDLAGAMGRRLPWAAVTVRNDIAAAAWRYRDLGRFAMVTVSTGVAVKVFDDALPFAAKLVEDPDGLAGEVGHVGLDPVDAPANGESALYRELGRAAARGDDAARARLAAADVAWCECGNVADLCAYTSGPATARAAVRLAQAAPDRWRGSLLFQLCSGRTDLITTYTLAAAATAADAFTDDVLRRSTRPLASRLLHLSAQLGLRRFVVMGGFAHGVGEPWIRALRDNLQDLLPGGGWFTGWTPQDVSSLVVPSIDGDDSLIGIGTFLTARREQSRELYKPVGEGHVVLRERPRPRCGREQFAVRVAFAGVCGTDLQILGGVRGCEPGILGHECVGEVVEVGADVRDIRVGQVVGVNPNHPRDAHDKLGHNQAGVFRETAVWDQDLMARGQVVPLPAAGLAEWVLLEPLACAVRSLDLGGTQWIGRRVLVIGTGVAGLLHVLLARHRLAERVLVGTRGGGRRFALAVQRGIVSAEDRVPVDGHLARAVRAATGGHGVDAAIVAVSGGAGPAVVSGLWDSLADGATVHLFGGFPADSVINLPAGGTVASREIRADGRRLATSLPGGGSCTLVGSRGATRADFDTARDLCTATRSPLLLSGLVSQVVSLPAAPAVLQELLTRGSAGGRPALRVVLDFRLVGTVVRQVGPADLPRLWSS